MKSAAEQFNHPTHLAGRHLSEERMYEFCRGGIAAEELAAARDHISQCADCLTLYREAHEFIGIQTSKAAEVSQDEIESEWQTLRQQLPQLAKQATPPPQTSWLNAIWPFQISPKPALAVALLAIVFGALGYAVFKPSPMKPKDIAQASPTPMPSLPASIAPSPSPAAVAPGPLPPSDEVIAMDVRGRESSPDDDWVRSEREEAVNALAAGQQLFIEVKGGRQFAASLTQRLQASGQFKLTTDREAAEIALKLSVRAAGPGRVSIFARIVNAGGKVIWPLAPRTSGRSFEGPTEKALDRLGRELLDDVRR
jgi:hypothetical protein